MWRLSKILLLVLRRVFRDRGAPIGSKQTGAPTGSEEVRASPMLFFPRLHDVHQRNDRNLVFLAIGDLNVVGRRVAEFYGLEQTFSRRGQCDRPRGRDAECNNRRLAKLRCCRSSKITLELPLLFVVRKCDMRRHGVAQMAKNRNDGAWKGFNSTCRDARSRLQRAAQSSKSSKPVTLPVAASFPKPNQRSNALKAQIAQSELIAAASKKTQD